MIIQHSRPEVVLGFNSEVRAVHFKFTVILTVAYPECARGGGEATFWLKKGVLASLYSIFTNKGRGVDLRRVRTMLDPPLF